ncbi:hypothetical protein ALP75_204673 [Pseudomonas syringae pv. actinidiae]|nr:hypothetical protein ALP75_204673 [Pseudomonas syringae pv. actinidiae]
MLLENHRRAAVTGVSDHQARAVLLFQQLARLGIGLGVVDQLLDQRFEQINLHRLQVCADSGVFGIFFRKRRQQWLQGQGNGFFVKLTQLVIGLAFPLRQAGQFFVETFLKGGNIFVKTITVGLGQLRELGFVQRLAIGHRCERDVGIVAIQRNVFLQRQALDHIQCAVVTLIERAVDRAFLLLIGRVLEHCREGHQQVVDQAADIGHELMGGARRQFQGLGLTGFIEVIDVNPVRRRLHALAFGLKVAFDEREAASAGLAHDKHVVTGARHGNAELQGFYGTLLAKYTAKGFKLVGGRKAELLSGKRTGQRVWRQA